MSHKETRALGEGYHVYVDDWDETGLVIALENSTCDVQISKDGNSWVSVVIPKEMAIDIGNALVMYGTGDEDFATLLTDILKGGNK